MCDIDGCGGGNKMAPLVVADRDRRRFLLGLASLPLAAVLADPVLAAAAAARLDEVSVVTPGGRTATAVVAMPANTPAPAVLLIHEWWGLNDQIKAVAAELAEAGYVALAVDLYGGQVATDGEQARALMSAVDAKAATEELAAWVDWLRNNDNTTGKVATIGWCFGGGWSLNASIAAPVDATVIYYGRVTRSAEDLKSLQGPVLGHFGTQDTFINQEMVSGFEQQMAAAGKSGDLQVYWYDANHAFANPTGARYDAEDASTAWDRTLTFLREQLS